MITSFMTRAGVRSAIAVAIACTTLAAGQAEAQDRSLKVWFGRQNFIPEDEFAKFREENPDIDVKFEVVRLEDVNSQLILALRSGNAPDIVQIHTRDVEQLARGGVVKDFTHMIDEMKTRFPETYAQLAPLAWEGASDSAGAIYGVALYAQSIYLTYRTDLLKQVGITPPLKTTDRVLEAAKAIGELGGETRGFSLNGCCVSPTWELPLFLSMGGQMENGVPQIDSEIGREWISFYQELMQSGAAHPDTPSWDSGQMRAAFIGGRAAMMNEGEHIYVEVHKQMPYEDGNWAFEALPTRPGQTEPQVQSGFAFPFIVTTANEDEEAAMLALEYLSRPDYAKQVAIRYQPTTNMAVASDAEYLAAKPWAEDVSPLSSNLVSLPTHPTKAIQVYDVIEELRDRMVADNKADPAALATEFQKKLDAVAN
ncbi:ABC transporter substrate-binding protein [Oceaniovalibus sp. ACAM 378]|uniref:ABC transporter substrate-binding protein n=1 Tax=Oceaniovalibus sp. ACAM 378 TaxID=2599923 RepID=UPI0011D7DD2D|nr:extracellular solute-binding protein [Oceaniovalibus sp. ACAM 378]TYB86749.1 extracellular solute-binding protein [Oceaniovalibus sp. ACAM 378]